MNLKKNKKILLIGSEGVLGSFFAKNLSRENDMLFVADIKIKKDKIKKNKIDFKLNLESENEIKNLFLNIKKKYGEIDVLVNNAALTTEGVKKLFGSEIKKEEFNTAIWDKTININMRGVFLSCKYFFKYHHNKNKRWAAQPTNIIKVRKSRKGLFMSGCLNLDSPPPS
jgi:NAD(P)-dependent dehydrogenase (short-subunit alcohol dehydrogenase family)